MRRLLVVLVLCGSAPIAAVAQEAEPARLREAAARALEAIQKAQAPWYSTNKQVCASCHHQYQPALAYRVARDHDVPFNEAVARADAVKAFDFSDIDRAVQYTHVIEPAVDDAYRMMAAHAAAYSRTSGPRCTRAC
jgi:hypothetical protein